jgi:hypothetical protein
MTRIGLYSAKGFLVIELKVNDIVSECGIVQFEGKFYVLVPAAKYHLLVFQETEIFIAKR